MADTFFQASSFHQPTTSSFASIFPRQPESLEKDCIYHYSVLNGLNVGICSHPGHPV